MKRLQSSTFLKSLATFLCLAIVSLHFLNCGPTRPRQGAKSIDELQITDWTWDDNGNLSSCPAVIGFDQDGDCIPDSIDPDPFTPNDWKQVCADKYPTIPAEEAQNLCMNDYIKQLEASTGMDLEDQLLMAGASNLGQILMGSVALLGSLFGLGKAIFGPAVRWVANLGDNDDPTEPEGSTETPAPSASASDSKEEQVAQNTKLTIKANHTASKKNYSTDLYSNTSFVGAYNLNVIGSTPSTESFLKSIKLLNKEQGVRDCDNITGNITFTPVQSEEIDTDYLVGGFSITKLDTNNSCFFNDADSSNKYSFAQYGIPKPNMKDRSEMLLIPAEYDADAENFNILDIAMQFSISVDKLGCRPEGGRSGEALLTYATYQELQAENMQYCEEYLKGKQWIPDCRIKNPLLPGAILEFTLYGIDNKKEAVEIHFTRKDIQLEGESIENPVPICFYAQGHDNFPNALVEGYVQGQSLEVSSAISSPVVARVPAPPRDASIDSDEQHITMNNIKIFLLKKLILMLFGK